MGLLLMMIVFILTITACIISEAYAADLTNQVPGKSLVSSLAIIISYKTDSFGTCIMTQVAIIIRGPPQDTGHTIYDFLIIQKQQEEYYE